MWLGSVLFCVYFILWDGQWVGAFQWYCKTNKDCTTPGTFCSEKYLCECTNGRVLSTDGSQCLQIATSPDYACTDSRQCTEWMLGPAECNNNVCGCSNGYRYLHGACVVAKGLNDYCESNAECYDGVNMESLQCLNNKCVCNDGFYERAKIDCRPLAKDFGKCFFDIDCRSDSQYCDFGYGPYGQCKDIAANSPQTVEIPRSYIEPGDLYDGNGLEQTCKADEDCALAGIENSFCAIYLQNCMCKSSYVYDKKSNNCVPAIGEACTDSCELRNSICNKGRCECKDFYITGYLNEKCYKPCRRIGDSCIHNKNCQSFGKHGVCVMYRCVCGSGSKFDDKLMLCRPAASDTEGCTIEDDCSYKPFSTCLNNKCVCKDDYYEEAGKCFAKLGTMCSTDRGECAIANAKCNGTCNCKDEFISNGVQECVPLLMDIKNENCQYDIQCEYYWEEGSVCSNNSCVCKPGYTLIDNDYENVTGQTCAANKYYGEVCTSLRDCQVSMTKTGVVCRNNRCSCIYGWVTNENGTRCVSKSAVILSKFALILYLFIACKLL